MKIAGVILAAGGSTRMGAPKQLLQFGGESFLRRAARTALAAGLAPAVVVLGAEAERLAAEVDDLPIETVQNTDWREGMGSSLSAGIGALDSEVDAALVMLCDQPLIDAAALIALVEAFIAAGSADAVAASGYGDTAGAPAVFGRAHFGALRTIKGDQGARRLLHRLGQNVVIVPISAASADVDTRAQYDALRPEHIQ